MATIQVTTFSLKPDVTAEQFITADHALQEWTYVNCPGIARRTTARNSSGQWITIRLYSDASFVNTEWFDSTDVEVTAWRQLVDESTIDHCNYDLL